jgi:hypothetical protein
VGRGSTSPDLSLWQAKVIIVEAMSHLVPSNGADVGEARGLPARGTSQARLRRRSQPLTTGVLYLALVGACAPIDELGALVPPTAAEDPNLPRVQVAFAGQLRWLHIASFGDPANPAVLVLPGGPGGDYRLLRPLQALSDTRFVVFWDVDAGGGVADDLDADAPQPSHHSRGPIL